MRHSVGSFFPGFCPWQSREEQNVRDLKPCAQQCANTPSLAYFRVLRGIVKLERSGRFPPIVPLIWSYTGPVSPIISSWAAVKTYM